MPTPGDHARSSLNSFLSAGAGLPALLAGLLLVALVSKLAGLEAPTTTTLPGKCMAGDGSVPSFVQAVKKRLKVPGSFKHESTRVSVKPQQGAHHIGMTYRAVNSYGAETMTLAYGLVAGSSCSAKLVGFQ